VANSCVPNSNKSCVMLRPLAHSDTLAIERKVGDVSLFLLICLCHGAPGSVNDKSCCLLKDGRIRARVTVNL
jgi:hypothetical protein